MPSPSNVPKVTVIVCAYKSGEAIIPTLSSILQQSFTDFELIVIDDASGDETPAIIQRTQDERIRLVVNETNLGVVGSRNKGVALARGEYIAHCDHDDIWQSEKLEKQVAYLDSHPDCGMVATGLAKYNLGRKLGSSKHVARTSNYLRWSLLIDSTFAHSAIMYRAKTVRDNSLKYHPELTFADDWDFFLQIAKVSDIGLIPESLTQYHLHDKNWSLRAGERMTDNGKTILLRELNYWIDRPVSKREVDAFFDTLVSFFPCTTRQSLLSVGKLLDELLDSFKAKNHFSLADTKEIEQLASESWWRAVASSAASLGPMTLRIYWHTDTPHWKKVPLTQLARVFATSTARALMPSFSL